MNYSQASCDSHEGLNGHVDGSEEDQIFSCRIENSKIMTDILIAIHAGSAVTCDVKASARALVFSVIGRGKSTQARATLPAEIFEEYIFESSNENHPLPQNAARHSSSTSSSRGDPAAPVLHFCINLTTLLDCLQIFGSTSETTAATLTYSNLDALFKVSLEESGVLTTCNLATLERDDVSAGTVTAEEARSTSLYYQFREHPETCRFILKADPLRDAIQDMCDVLGGGDVTFHTTREPEEVFKLSLRGSLDQFEVEFPKASGAFVLFQCEEETRWSYLNASIQLGMKALAISKETFIRINSEGLMSIQHQIKEKKSGAEPEPYIDFFILPVDNGNNSNLC